MDAKATVAVGPFSRKGKSRVKTHASDHDFKPKVKITPVGILLPDSAELFTYAVTSKVTSDCLVDCLSRCWETIRDRFPTVTTLQLNLDNGPENHSRRTQFMARIVDFVRQYGVTVQLAYYPLLITASTTRLSDAGAPSSITGTVRYLTQCRPSSIS